MSEQSKNPVWPENHVEVSAVQDWIGSAFPEHTAVIGPTQVYRANDWGVTARFTVQHGGDTQDVVCKVGFLPIFTPSPAIYGLLRQALPESVPHLLASRLHEEQTWMLFEPFAGDTVRQTGTFDSLLAMAQTMGRVQVAVSEVLSEKENVLSSVIPTIPLQELPALFDRLMADIKTHYLPVWQTKAADLAKDFHLPEQGLTKIADLSLLGALQKQVHLWCSELQQLGWPDSIDHIDLHTANAAVKPDGDVLIFDWEEAVLSFPFLCIDRLLDEAPKFDQPDAEPIVTEHGMRYTSSQFAVRDAYLDSIPWNSRAERERAFDVAMCLQPVKYAYQGTFFLNQVGWQDAAPGIIATSIIRAVERWEAFRK